MTRQGAGPGRTTLSQASRSVSGVRSRRPSLRAWLRDDRGFTLGELLIVMVVLMILTAVAIPVHAHQRRKGWRTQVIGTLRNMASIQESWRYRIGASGYALEVYELQGEGFTFSDDDVAVMVVSAGPEAYCHEAISKHDAKIVYHFDSRAGRALEGPAPSDCGAAGTYVAATGPQTSGSETSDEELLGDEAGSDGIGTTGDDGDGSHKGSGTDDGSGGDSENDGSGDGDDADGKNDGKGDGDGKNDKNGKKNDKNGKKDGKNGKKDGKNGNHNCKNDSDPDGDENGGADKPGGSGGEDQSDQDCNNGSGNDDDDEDDNNGGGKG